VERLLLWRVWERLLKINFVDRSIAVAGKAVVSCRCPGSAPRRELVHRRAAVDGSSTRWRWQVSLNELRAKPAWLVTVAAVRAIATMGVLLALYYLLPLDGGGTDLSTFGKLALGLGVFLGVMTWHVRLIGKSENPALRALEGVFLGLLCSCCSSRPPTS
jgi:hypothetical protein